ncbi:XRE family transcriptional regulator [Streptomyces sp. ICN441]|uniref:helix-turn-helix domain-containing protein n=1 Tax=Streptomyces sp. ICN441 TaxID=2558286 RepID=UPI00106D996B|nr:helix-turn-helix transcriptional regulator [Streptomyces sp. ICN441]TFE38555.1 XRE family transcriptional regulator [Streptomyces sp. ICN441]
MGRKEKPVKATIVEVGKLAYFQREWRRRAGLSYDELAKATGVSATTLRSAASGACVRPWKVVLAAVEGCGGPAEEAYGLWKRARYHQRLLDKPREPAPPPLLVYSVAELKAAVVELYELNGAPALAELEDRAGLGRLPHSTAAPIVKGMKLPATGEQFEAFLIAVEVEEAERAVWMEAWERIRKNRKPDPRAWTPNHIFTESQLPNYLFWLYQSSGSPPVPDMERRTGGRLDRATARHMLSGGLPPGVGAFEAFLDACGVTREQRGRWMEAWDRVESERRSRTV